MNPMRLFAAVILLVGINFATVSVARAEIVEGRDYTVLPHPQPTHSGNNIEVIEFFWYVARTAISYTPTSRPG